MVRGICSRIFLEEQLKIVLFGGDCVAQSVGHHTLDSTQVMISGLWDKAQLSGWGGLCSVGSLLFLCNTHPPHTYRHVLSLSKK